MTFQEFSKKMDNLAELLDQGISDAANVELQSYIVQMKNAAPKKSGDLKDSIKGGIRDQYTLYIQMLNYGFFQNYGVIGGNNKLGKGPGKNPIPVDEDLRTIAGIKPTSGEYYKFGIKRPVGIKSRGFFEMAAVYNAISTGIQDRIDTINNQS
jgi:hypothetical protein